MAPLIAYIWPHIKIAASMVAKWQLSLSRISVGGIFGTINEPISLLGRCDESIQLFYGFKLPAECFHIESKLLPAFAAGF